VAELIQTVTWPGWLTHSGPVWVNTPLDNTGPHRIPHRTVRSSSAWHHHQVCIHQTMTETSAACSRRMLQAASAHGDFDRRRLTCTYCSCVGCLLTRRWSSGVSGWYLVVPIVDTLHTKWSHVNHISDIGKSSPVKDRHSNHWAMPSAYWDPQAAENLLWPPKCTWCRKKNKFIPKIKCQKYSAKHYFHNIFQNL